MEKEELGLKCLDLILTPYYCPYLCFGHEGKPGGLNGHISLGKCYV